MRYFEVSKKINLTQKAKAQDLKQGLLDRLQRAFTVGDLKETDQGFSVQIQTGGRSSMIKNAQARIDAQVIESGGIGRVIVSGGAKISPSLMIWYTILFFFVLVLGLLPGSIETSGENSGAMDVLVFLIFGLFLGYDIDKKLGETRDSIQAALDSLDAEFG